MTAKRIEGIVTPMVTPLLKNGTIDMVGVKKQIDRLIDAGIAGIFILGTTGEGPALPRELQRELIEESAKVIGGRCPLLVGISAASLADSLELGRFARNAGANALVAAPPCYIPADEQELETFFRILAEKLDLPLYIYNMPAMTMINMSPELIARLAAIPGIVGYKDSAGDMANFIRVLSLLKDREDFSVMMGPDTLMCEAVSKGAVGGVNSGSNLCPELFVAAYRAAKCGAMVQAAYLQKKIVRLQDVYKFRSNICCGVIVGLKSGLYGKGVCGTAQTLPSRPAEAETVSAVADIVCELDSGDKSISVA